MTTVEEITLINNKKFCERCKLKNWLIECACNCGEIITLRDQQGHHTRFVKKHGTKGKHMGKNGDGRYLCKGYWWIYKRGYFSSYKNGCILEHIFVYQEHHKCCILPWCEIHHIDGHPEFEDGNRLENLQLMTKAQHLRLHKTGNKNGKKDMSGRICLLCNSITTRILKKTGRPVWHVYKNGYLCGRCHQTQYRKQRKNRYTVPII